MADKCRWRMSWRTATAVAIAALGLMISACAPTRDFGRPPRTGLFAGDPAATWRGDEGPPAKPSGLGLTADEARMRDAAVALRRPTGDLGPGGGHDADRNYADRLTRAGFAFGPSRLARIDHEIAADHDALTRFGHVARRVAFADHERGRALSDSRLRASARDRRQAIRRAQENRAFMFGTLGDLQWRIESYRTAIDRTRIETPAVSPVEPAAALAHLSDRAASLRYELMQVYAYQDGPENGGAPHVPRPGK